MKNSLNIWKFAKFFHNYFVCYIKLVFGEWESLWISRSLPNSLAITLHIIENYCVESEKISEYLVVCQILSQLICMLWKISVWTLRKSLSIWKFAKFFHDYFSCYRKIVCSEWENLWICRSLSNSFSIILHVIED